MRKIDKNYNRPGVIRLKFLEYPYRWWKSRSSDTRFAIIPIFLSLAFGVFIYNSANFFIERDITIKQKAKLDENATEENFKKFLEEKKK